MVLGIQLLGTIFAVFMLYVTFLNQKRKEFSPREYGFWLAVWIVFIILTLFPQILSPIVKTLNLVRTMDLFIILGFMLIMGTTFHVYSKIKKMRTKIEKVVREIAIKKADKK